MRASPQRARGAALIVLLALIGVAITAVLVSALAGGTVGDPDRQTERALSIAHQALIDYAVSVQPDSSAKRPGDLPCPDLDNDGDAEPTCANASQRIGRLPVETLEIPDLVDGHGERLWYALSTNFRRSTGNQCATPGQQPGCLNSETPGTLTVRAPNGTIVHDGSTLPSGAIAVIFSPGPPLTRAGASTPQDRSCAGDADVANCQLHRKCSDVAGTTALCNPVNYLDVATAPAEDNADFVDSTANGFIQGPIFDATGNKILNDRLMVLRYSDLMPRLEQRVAREALRCLSDYAAASANHFPWAASTASDYTAQMTDGAGVPFGRLAQSLPASHASNVALNTYWPRSCPISMDQIDPSWLLTPAQIPQEQAKKQWWANWTNLVFYRVAAGYAPDQGVTGCGAGCLTVNAPSTADKKVVVIVAGRAFVAQTRGPGTAASNYLEDANAAGGTQFKQAPATAMFNDSLLFL